MNLYNHKNNPTKLLLNEFSRRELVGGKYNGFLMSSSFQISTKQINPPTIQFGQEGKKGRELVVKFNPRTANIKVLNINRMFNPNRKEWSFLLGSAAKSNHGKSIGAISEAL